MEIISIDMLWLVCGIVALAVIGLIYLMLREPQKSSLQGSIGMVEHKVASHQLTLLYIEIVGYSNSFDDQNSTKVALSTSRLNDQIVREVNNSGGVIVSNTAGRFLCIFGYPGGNSNSKTDQAKQAVNCAIEIQRKNASQCINDNANEIAPVFAIRMAINTGNVCVEQNGLGYQIDMNVTGKDVHFVDELNSRCDNFLILVNASTYELLQASGFHKILVPRKIQLAKNENFINVYECNPFANELQTREKITGLLRSFSRSLRKHERFSIPNDVLIKVKTSQGEGSLRNFSRTGFAVQLDHYLALGSYLSFQLDSDDPNFQSNLKQMNLSSISGDIRWARQESPNAYLHGVLFSGLGETEKDKLMTEINRVVSDSNKNKVG